MAVVAYVYMQVHLKIKHIKYLINTFDENFYYAIVLLGAFFGFRKFYDVYYDAINLRFYKHNSDLQNKNLNTEKEIIETTNNPTDSLENKANNLMQRREKDNNPKEILIIEDSLSKDKTGETLVQYKKIIEEEFKIHSEIKLSDISNLIKKHTGKKINQDIIKNIISQMELIEITPKKNPATARRKEQNTTLFND